MAVDNKHAVVCNNPVVVTPYINTKIEEVWAVAVDNRHAVVCNNPVVVTPYTNIKYDKHRID